MAVTTAQYNALLERITALEESFNDVVVAIDRFVTLSQVQQLFTVIQTDIDDTNTTVSALETRVTAIEEEPLT